MPKPVQKPTAHLLKCLRTITLVELTPACVAEAYCEVDHPHTMIDTLFVTPRAAEAAGYQVCPRCVDRWGGPY